MVYENISISDRTKCLIFLEASRTEGGRKIPVSISSARIYALVEETHKTAFQEFFRDFSRVNILIAEKDEDITELPKNLTFEIFEFEFTYSIRWNMYNREIPSADVAETSDSIVKSLFHRVMLIGGEPSRDTDDSLFLNVIEENIRFIEKWLYHGAELSYRSRNRETLLHFAVRMDSECLVNVLLRFRFDVAAFRCDGFTPLHLAAKRGHLASIILLIRYGASIYPPVENYRNITPLMLAAKKGHLNAAQALIIIAHFGDIGSYVNLVRRPDGWSCLHLAAWKGHSAVVETLIQYGANLHARITEGLPAGPTPLVLAVEEGQFEVVEALLKAGSDVNTSYDTDGGRLSILDFALSNNDLRMTELILAHNPDPRNDFNRIAFYHALISDNELHKRSVEIMCQKGFTMDEDILETLHDLQVLDLLFAAILKNCSSVAIAVLNNRAIVNLTDRPNVPGFVFHCTPLHLAAATADVGMVQLLIDGRADINILDSAGRKPLFYAVARGSMSVLEYLIVNQAQIEDQPELMYAAIYRGDPEIMRTLLHNGVRVNELFDDETLHLPIADVTTARTSSDSDPPVSVNVTIKFEERLPPIFYAASKGNTEIIKIMLKYGAINTVEYLHFHPSPLMRAAECRNFEAFSVFLENMFPKTDPSCGLKASFRRERRPTHAEYSNTVAQYLLKVKSCGFPVCTSRLSDLWTLPITIKAFQADCETEISELRNETVFPGVTYYDILMKDVDIISGYARHDSVVEVFRTGEHREKFPIYGSSIEFKFEKGYHRRGLIIRGVKICSILIDHFQTLPLNLKEMIIEHLNNVDLQYLAGKSYILLKED